MMSFIKFSLKKWEPNFDLEVLGCEPAKEIANRAEQNGIPTINDYFTDNVASTDALRQLWVEQTGKKRIIQAAVSLYGMTVTAVIQNK